MNESIQTRVLVVEDDPDTRELLKTILTQVGHDVTIVSDGLEALEALRTSVFNVMITDIVMPKMDGEELLQMLATQMRQIQVLVLTAIDEDEELCVCRIVHRMSKPFDNAVLVAKVEELARQSGLSVN